MSGDICLFCECTFKIASLPARSGSSTGIRRSKRPGRSSAGSSVSGRLVAARITTPFLPSKPSISVSSWLRVCSLSSLPPIIPLSRFLPMVSISSIKTIQGAFSCACANRSRTLAAPAPTNISTNSEPDIEKNGTFASPATALASSVLPVPGGPTSSAPFGIWAPMASYFCGLCRKSTISCKASLASSSPATSAKVLPVWAGTYTFALLLPKVIALLPPPILFCSERASSCPSSANSRIGPPTLISRYKNGDIGSSISLP